MFKFLRFSVLALASTALAASTAAPDASLSGLWFKVKLAAKGYAARDDGSAPRKVSGGSTVYLQLVVNDLVSADGPSLPETSYFFNVWVPTLGGAWQQLDTNPGNIESTDGRSYFVSDIWVELLDINTGFTAGAHMTGLLQLKRDKAGNATSCSFTTLGAEACEGETPGGEVFRGGFKLSGKTIPVAKLPFTP